MSYLYRGVSKRFDLRSNGKLYPKGNKPKLSGLHDGNIKYDGSFTYGESENNAARAQQIQSGLYESCYISTTKNLLVAVEFATAKYTEDGYIYVIDSQLFEKFGVNSIEFPDPLYAGEFEVSIRSFDNGPIPHGVIIDKFEIDKNGNNKI